MSESSLRDVAPGTWSLGLEVPTSPLVSATNCYLIESGDGAVYVVDPGWDTPSNEAALMDALDDHGSSIEAIGGIVVTHLHADHLGLARRLGDEYRVELIMHTEEYAAAVTPDERFLPESLRRCFQDWGVPANEARQLADELKVRYDPVPSLPGTRTVEDGERLPIAGRVIRAMHTPGHTTGHLCLLDEENDALLSGDLVLPSITPGVGLGAASATNPLTDMIQSLGRVSELPALCLPGHGKVFTGIDARCAEILSRYDTRTAQVREVAGEDPSATVWGIATRLRWNGGAWNSLAPYFRRSAMSQVAMHVARIRGGVPESGEWRWA